MESFCSLYVSTSRHLMYWLYCNVCEDKWFHRPFPNFDDHKHAYDTTCIIKCYFCGLCRATDVDLALMYKHMLRHLQFGSEIMPNINRNEDIYFLSSTDDSSTDNESDGEE